MIIARRIVGAGAGCLAALLLAGCVPESGGVPGKLERGLEEAQSCTQTALLALQQQRDGRTTPQQAHTAVDDAITKLGEEQNTLAKAEPSTAAERSWRLRTDAALTSADQALKDARSAASGAAGIRWSAAIAELEKANAAVESANDALVKQAGDQS